MQIQFSLAYRNINAKRYVLNFYTYKNSRKMCVLIKGFALEQIASAFQILIQ
jgi:hypothetical protein